MLNRFKMVATSGLLAISALSSMTAGARAEGLYFGLDSDGETRAGIILDDGTEVRRDDRRDRHDDRRDRRDDRWDRRDDDWDRRDRRRERECTPERALDKAERIGLYRVRISDVGRRTIEVVGRRDGRRIYVTFARAPNCPIIR